MYRYLALILLLSSLLSCSQQRPVEPLPQKARPAENTAPRPPVPPTEVAILVSSDLPAYREVADSLMSKLGARAKIWYLQEEREVNAQIVAEVGQSERPQVVAIGLNAAIASKEFNDRQVIFCQVFNYEDHKLPSSSVKGVGMLPSFTKSFAAWKAISPNLKQIAIFTGPGMDEYVRSAKATAKKKGITLLHKEVFSDMELLVEYKGIADKVQGYWLWPDNRVLSMNVMQEVLTFSVRHGKQVAVFNDELLELGGLLSITSDHRDIASNVVKRLEQAKGKTGIPGEVIEPLDRANLRINGLMAKRFELMVPQQYRKYLDAP